jgi:hypothetical protein
MRNSATLTIIPVAENHHSDSSQPSAAGRVRWLTVLFLLVATSLFYWRITLTNQFTWLDSNDIAFQVLPWFQFEIGEIQQGRLPLWDPYPYGGQPLIGQAQPGVAYPFNWVFFVMPTQHGWIRQNIAHWYFVLIHFMGVLFAYKLCRDQGRSDAAAVFGGLLFGLGGYMGYVDWPQMLNGAVWAPLVLMYLLRVSRGERVWASAALGGMCLGLALLSGHHQIPTFIALASGAIWCWLIRQRLELWPGLPLFFGVAGFTSGLQSLPAWEYSKLAVRWVGAPEPVGHTEIVPYWVHDLYSFLPVNLVGVAIPGLDPGMSFYVGVIAMMLGCIGIWRAWRWTAVRIATAVLAGSLIFASGAHTIFHGMFYSLFPIVEKARSPLMATLVSLVCLALLVSYGVDALRERLPADGARKLGWTLTLGGAFIMALFWAMYVVRDNAWHQDTRASTAGIVALAAAAVLAGWQRQALTAPAMLTSLGVLLFIELGMGGVSNMPHRDKSVRNVPVMAADKPWVDAIRKLGPDERVELSNEDRPHNFGDWNGVNVWHSYLASLTTNLKEMYLHEGRTRELFGVQYSLRQKSKPAEEWGEAVRTDEAGFTIYRNRGAMPRAWAVHEIVEAKNFDQFRRFMDDRAFRFRQRAFMRGSPGPSLERCAGAADDVRILRRVSDRVVIWADLECGGMAVLSDVFYPGWTATIDGKAAGIHEVYGALRGVVTPKGKHRIEMRYRPWSVYLGFVMTVLGVAAGLVISRLDRPRYAGSDRLDERRNGSGKPAP